MLALIFIFYSTPLRNHVENKLYDLRTVMKPASMKYDDLAIVEIDAESLIRMKGSAEKDLSAQDLSWLVDKLFLFDVKAVVVMLYPNIFDYTSYETGEMVAKYADNNKVFFGVMGLDTDVPSGRSVPEKLLPIEEQTAGMEIFRERRHDFVRDINFFAYRGTQKVPLLPLYLSDAMGGMTELNTKEHFDHKYWLNYIHPNDFYRLSATMLMDEDIRHLLQRQLAGRTVFLGYTVYRDRAINSNQISVNTPWQREGEDPALGMPLLYVMASSFANMYYESWLQEAVYWAPIMQTVVVTLFSVLVWTLGTSLAIFFIVVSWIALIYIHALFFAYGFVMIPLADTALFSAFGVLAGSIWRLRVEGQLQLNREVVALSQKNLAREQARFLLAFTDLLAKINEKVIATFQIFQGKLGAESTTSKLVSKVQAAAEDFRDYLRGMAEFAHLDEGRSQSHKSVVLLKPLVQKILQQFNYRMEEQEVGVDLQIASDFRIYTDETLLEPIIFNLISNAIKYSPRGENIRVTAKNLGRHHIVLEVSDRGPGIPPEFHQRIFEKFYRVEGAASHKVKGSGLGLYLSQFFASKLGVKIEVQSNAEEGSTFIIRFSS